MLSYSCRQEKGQKPYSFDIREGWKFIAATLNRRPSVFTSAFLCFFLEIAGYSLYNAFGSQFRKLMLTIENSYLAKLPNQSRSYNESLKIVLEKLCTANKVQKPKGMEINE